MASTVMAICCIIHLHISMTRQVTFHTVSQFSNPKPNMASGGSGYTPEEKQMLREFRSTREAMEVDIRTHKQAVERAITQLRIDWAAHGISRPLRPPERPLTLWPSTRRLNILLAGQNIPPEPPIPYPDPDEDSGSESNPIPRICYTDHSVSCTRHEWLSWVSKFWGEYSSLKATEKTLQESLRKTIITYTDLEAKHLLNDAGQVPKKYRAKFNKEILDKLGGEMIICRKLRSILHKLLPAFEWCD
ncbi:hypothetical protein L211DRAFT_853676 [Terfezia boudieri ATCC MYA-4762]|uniref:Transcription activator GCR1-like domain-containing protein n=1 Tax=Terfezia boudieri ATCC MYA-4762 TaxID=1051890 RepID=A0A3N4LBT3_9PEZI|nr:hypothetical protein L211DRAFT_853676 [Terfezia boudieri ATCC MYA-4762]